jgi:dolichol-phosphate mannosyltransferase
VTTTDRARVHRPLESAPSAAGPATAGVTVWLVLPAYNEAENLPPLLDRVRAAWSGRFPYRVLVVDDGSRDETASAAEAAAHHLPVELIRHDHNRGLAAAIRTGIREACRRAADNDVIVTMDADNSHPPELVSMMLTSLEAGCDLVIASRFVRGGREEGVPWRRRMLSRAAGLVFRCLCPIPGVRDYTTGFRAYRAALLKNLWNIHGDRLIEAAAFSVMTELLLKARRLRPRIAEVPLVLRYDLKEGASKMRLGKTIRDYARLLSREFRTRRSEPRVI